MFATAKENINSAKENMTNEGSPIPQNVKDSVHRMKSDSRDAAATLKSDAEDLARQAGKHVREFTDAATHGVSDITHTMKTHMREKPLQSGLIALAVGMFVGMLYRRR